MQNKSRINVSFEESSVLLTIHVGVFRVFLFLSSNTESSVRLGIFLLLHSRRFPYIVRWSRCKCVNVGYRCYSSGPPSTE